ncbi:insecticyanin-A-like [Neocloeon triangulifer]|uniref:insecticyanin-A-like n=1 Tax=Neocloeon triangulifer TaxID=2078957 RepID=UPI00286F8637|nr:insecticyanin-A-like [Neocloeon triangulifer]
MRQEAIFVCAILCTLALADDTCPDFSSKKPFDAAKFAGTWHTLAYIEHPTHTGPMKCGKVEVTHSKNGAGKTTLNYKYDYFENGKRNVAYKLSQALHPETPGRLQSTWRMEGETTWSNAYESSVIATDYENYAVEVLCAYYYIEPHNAFIRSYYAQILGRKTSLPADTLKTLKEILTNYDIPQNIIRDLDNSNCAN